MYQMEKPKLDVVVEAVHYKPNGEVDWVRAYTRRGPTFSDHILIQRPALIDQIKAGKKVVAGERVPLMASTFDVSTPLHLLKSGAKDILVTGDIQSDRDYLEGVPLI
jgi:hypothetical protein